MFTLLIGFCIGMGVSFQTAINARLRSYLGVPFLSSLVSFSGGTLFLALLANWQGYTLIPDWQMIHQAPWWVWIGGLMGMVALTANILLFPKLGGVQTAIIPLLGQVLMGILIDSFGWFGSPYIELSIIRLAGVGLVLAGMFCAVVLPNLKQSNRIMSTDRSIWFWRLFGIGAGMLMASQTAINAELGRELNASIQAAFISFLVGGTGLFFVVMLYERSFHRLKNGIGKGKPWWIWFGGTLGALFIFGSIILVPQIGTGGAIVLVLLGLISGSLLVDKFGLLGAIPKRILPIQLLGLGILICGVALIQLIK
ncbi:hypothetical protein RO21_00510 [[Actinobacillus] muris]|uniref:DMT family transporter n=1 Tax=Muribacter muris TaxID=67855 RepID=A0A0J5P9W9_9PAST|nr:DMT family transporter [Muribacter muris]KMK52535.1 hypothetical protein RO21_00510 [[Actinobacillus] muris] [Muribacter muris]